MRSRWRQDSDPSSAVADSTASTSSSSSQSGPLASLSPAQLATRVRINIGGQVFETTARVLLRSHPSALSDLAERSIVAAHGPLGTATPADAALPSPPSTSSMSSAMWFFDRDWWVFRDLLQYLREGETALPRSREALRALYAEARFFGVAALREAVRRQYQRLAAAEAERAAVAGTVAPLVAATVAAVPLTGAAMGHSLGAAAPRGATSDAPQGSLAAWPGSALASLTSDPLATHGVPAALLESLVRAGDALKTRLDP